MLRRSLVHGFPLIHALAPFSCSPCPGRCWRLWNRCWSVLPLVFFLVLAGFTSTSTHSRDDQKISILLLAASAHLCCGETLKPLRSDRLAALPDRSMTPVAGSPAQHDFFRLHELAVVHWHETVHAPLDAVNLYLQERWDLHTSALELMDQSWFREGGLWVRVTLPGADPAPAEAQQQTMP